MNTQSLIRKCNHKHDIKSITQNFKDEVQNDNGDYYCVNTEYIIEHTVPIRLEQ